MPNAGAPPEKGLLLMMMMMMMMILLHFIYLLGGEGQYSPLYRAEKCVRTDSKWHVEVAIVPLASQTVVG